MTVGKLHLNRAMTTDLDSILDDINEDFGGVANLDCDKLSSEDKYDWALSSLLNDKTGPKM